MRLRTGARQDRPAGVPLASGSLPPLDPTAGGRAALPANDAGLAVLGDLQLPAPARLALTAGWNLAESLGLPVVAYFAAERLGVGQGVGMAAATATIWLAAAARKVVTGG